MHGANWLDETKEPSKRPLDKLLDYERAARLKAELARLPKRLRHGQVAFQQAPQHMADLLRGGLVQRCSSDPQVSETISCVLP